MQVLSRLGSYNIGKYRGLFCKLSLIFLFVYWLLSYKTDWATGTAARMTAAFQQVKAGQIVLRKRIYNTSFAPEVKETNVPLEPEQECTPHANNVVLDETLPGTFQEISGEKLWVYSAHYDQPFLRAFGIANGSFEKASVYCHDKSNLSLVYRCTIHALPDSHSLKYAAAEFVCPIPKGARPQVLSFTLTKTGVLSNHVPVVYPGPRKRNFTICFGPLFGQFDGVNKIIQAIEINQVLGAEHMFMYTVNVSKRVNDVLTYYENLGVLTVLPWPVPKVYVWYHGQNALIHDCVYRNKNVSQFVAIHDIDEFIFPARHTNWMDLLTAAENDVRRRGNKKVLGSFVFESAWFRGKTPQDVWNDVNKTFPVTNEEMDFFLKHHVEAFTTLKRANVIRFKSKTKSIVRPEMVIHPGIHYTIRHRWGVHLTVVNNSLAIVHHYRTKGTPVTVNFASYKFKSMAYPRLKNAYEKLAGILD